jgi:hypothetical protein
LSHLELFQDIGSERGQEIITSKQTDHLLIVREWGSQLGFNSEIESSLIDFYGEDKVSRVVITNSESVIESLRTYILKYAPKRIYFDSRIFISNAKLMPLTGHLLDCARINQLFITSKVIPICFVTDPNQPGYCLVADLITSNIGLMIPIAGDFSIKPHKGRKQSKSIFNPISINTCKRFMGNENSYKYDLYLGGSSYEPRKSYFEAVLKGIEHLGLRVYLASKELNSYDEYLNNIANSRIVINTNYIVNSITKKHMVGRNIETFACGSMLITQNTSTLQSYFSEGRDYVAAETPIDAIREIERYHFDDAARSKIALNGQVKTLQYAEEHFFVGKIESEIGKCL